MNDRIERAFDIIANDGVRGEHNGRWFVQSQSSSREYETGVFFCECPDAAQNGNICKHQLAGPAALVTLACVSFRNDAGCESELHDIGAAFAEKFAQLPASYVQIARDEYKKQLRLFRLAESAQRLAAAA
jgi:hypothetical protein